MKYIIKRTSIWSNEAPHPDAKNVTLEHYRDIRTFKSKEEWLSKFPNDVNGVIEWGEIDNHTYRVVDGSHITIWVIEIDDILEFLDKLGEDIILSKNKYSGYVGYENCYTLEIYDNYRE